MAEKNVLFAKNNKVVSIGHFPAFYAILVPLEYVPNIPLHSSYIIDFFHTFQKVRGPARY